jgi:hypothetical protein
MPETLWVKANTVRLCWDVLAVPPLTDLVATLTLLVAHRANRSMVGPRR